MVATNLEAMDRKRRAMPNAGDDTRWRNRITGHGEVDPGQLTANPRNWRIHPEAQQGHMENALDRTGWVRRVIVCERSGFVVDGHMRVALALRHGQTTIPVDYVDLTEEEEVAVLMTFDPIASLAGVDRGKLRQLESEARVGGSDLSGLLGGMLGRAPAQAEDGFDETGTREATFERYSTSEERRINLVMSQREYASVITRFGVIANREGLETNRDVLMWLIGKHREARA